MKNIFKSTLVVLITALISYSCSNDDQETVSIPITLQDLDVTIDENPTNGQTIGMVQTDSDGTTSYSITSQIPTGALSVNSSTGELTVANALLFDFETNPTITATIAVVGAQNTATVTIDLNDLNEISAQNLTVAIDENPVNGESIGNVQVEGNGPFTFSIESQTPAGAMAIDASTGELTVADASMFNFEINPTVTGTIAVAGAESTSTVTINLNDLDEISADDLTVAIDENPTDGQVVGAIQANGSGNLNFTITSQAPAAALNIDASTGELTVADPTVFDFETNPVITATIEVDNGVTTAPAIATINLNDVDEVTAQNTNLDIDENPSNGDMLGALQASGSNLTYTITFQNPAGAFNIDQSTGELSVADETLFDFETNPNMLATISVDNGTQSVSANAMVALNDMNELGEFKYGGVIFWIDPASNNSGGLVCALENQTSAPWGCVSTTTGATGTAIGTGGANTSTIISAGCATGSAAEFVSNLNYNGYDDWFLPSLDEFNEISTNYSAHIWPTIQANGGSALFGSVWTSSEVNSNNAYIAFLGGSNPIAMGKSADVFNILPIRAFTD